MSRLVVLSLAEQVGFGLALADSLRARHETVASEQFPDGESHITLPADLTGCRVIVNCSLAQPDPKLAPLLFIADAARDLGATQVGLVAPYLAYMRQDRRFHPGEAITSRTFARVVSAAFDWLATMDPHLHRYASLDEIYTIPSRIVHSAPLLGRWIGAQVDRPLILGPDAESEQWVSEVAGHIGAPFAVFSKTRLGDKQVRIDRPDLSPYAARQPVLVDDIVSSGRTMIEASRQLAEAGFAKPVCVVTHPLFAGDALEALTPVVASIASCDTVAHPSNAITVAPELAAAVTALLATLPSGELHHA